MATFYYQVTVKTGKKSGAGTDADVYITLFGEAGQLTSQLDKAGYDDFESGDKDNYLVSTTEGKLGRIYAIRLEHNNKGSGSGWYVEDVHIDDFENNSRGPSKKYYNFPVNRWLATDESDGKTYVEIGNRPTVKIIQDPLAYEGVQVGIESANLFEYPLTGQFKEELISKTELTIMESTEHSSKEQVTVSTNAELSVSYGEISGKLGVDNSFSKEMYNLVTKSITKAESGEKKSVKSYNFEPEKDQTVGVVYYIYQTQATGKVGIGDRTFDFVNINQRWTQPVMTLFKTGSDELEDFKMRYEQYL